MVQEGRDYDMTDENHKGPKKMSQKPPPPQRQRSSGKTVSFEVVLLDGEHQHFELDKNAEGKDLLEKVCQHLDLIEKDYFGLQYVDERLPQHLKCWLSPDKKISKQKKRGPWVFDFGLKFYPPDPTALRESLTRWLVTLQVRRDILSGKLPATFLTVAMLGSYNVQADLGDYDPNEHHGIEYVKDIPFSPNQTSELLEKIVELHRQHKGQTPDEAEMHFLENAKKLSMYGVDLHAAQDVNNVDIMLGVCASGLQVYREKLRISRFVWPKILKISYKRKHFYIKVRPSDNHAPESSVCFKLATHRLAKRLWKICVEHHAFFRLRETDQPQNSAMFPRLGSKFRYSGRTLYQARHNSQILDRPDPYFERSQPARSTYAAPNRASSADELRNRDNPPWKDDATDFKKRPPSGSDGRDRKDYMDQPTHTSQLGKANDGKSGYEDGADLRKGPDDSRDRHDRIPSQGDNTLEHGKGKQGSMGLSPGSNEMEGPKETEKERKKREKEEEKRKKKEEEDRKKAEKAAAKKGKGNKDTTEDRTDQLGKDDPTMQAGNRKPGTFGDEHGGRLSYEIPVGGAPGDKDNDHWDPSKDGPDSDKDRWGPGKGRTGSERDGWSPGRDGPPGADKDRWGAGKKGGPDSDDDRFPPGKDRFGPGSGEDRWGPGKNGDDPDRVRLGPGGERLGSAGDRWGPGSQRPGSGRDKWGPGRDGLGADGDKYGPGRDGLGADGDKYGPGMDGLGADGDKYGPGRDGLGADGDKYGPGRDGLGANGDKYGPGRDGLGADGDKYGPGRDGPGSDKDQWSPGKGPGMHVGFNIDGDKDKKGRKGSEKDDDKEKKKKEDGKDKDKHKKDKDKDGDKDKKGGGLFSKFKKPKDKDSKSKLPEDGTGGHPGDGGHGGPGGKGYGDEDDMGDDLPAWAKSGKKSGKTPVPLPTDKKGGVGFPGYGIGAGLGAGDMSGVVGDETWIDNKQIFHPIEPRKKESKEQLKGGLGVDRTMPFFSPAATSTVGRPGKVPPPVPRKSGYGDDSFNRTDVYKTEKDGIQETRVEHKVVVSSTDDDFDYDAALADAIRSVTEFNPDMSVERIECVQQIEDVKDK